MNVIAFNMRECSLESSGLGDPRLTR